MAKSDLVSPARQAAFEILSLVEEGGFAANILASWRSNLKDTDRTLTQELVLGVLRQQLFLDSLIEHYSDRKVVSLDRGVLLTLRLGLYQLKFLTRVPASAAVNESVNLVRQARLRSAGGFVNAVLRRATREPDYDPAAERKDPVERLAIETSHPAWLLRRWIKSFGNETAADMARANNHPPTLSFRVVHNVVEEDDVIERLTAAGGEIARSSITRRGWSFRGSAAPLRDLVGRGQVYIQDDASILVSEIVDLAPGERFLDVCSAPGSKTTAIADWAHNEAAVVAVDVNPARLRQVTETAKLHNLGSIHAVLSDGLALPFAEKSFDAVLVDAPCSGTGTLRRNPEIRWRITPADILDLSLRQQMLLSHAAMVVRSNGRLIYSTCSVEEEEDEGVVRNFLERHPDFKQIEVHGNVGLLMATGAIRTWPQHGGVDGFFVAVFRRE